LTHKFGEKHFLNFIGGGGGQEYCLEIFAQNCIFFHYFKKNQGKGQMLPPAFPYAPMTSLVAALTWKHVLIFGPPRSKLFKNDFIIDLDNLIQVTSDYQTGVELTTTDFALRMKC